MATDKDAEAKKDVEPKKDAATGEKSIDYLVDGLTEDELKGVSGGLGTGDVTKSVMCSGVTCTGLMTKCYAMCGTMRCPAVSCGELKCGAFSTPS